MRYCTYCGAPLEDGGACQCQGAVTAAEQPPFMQQPYRKPEPGRNMIKVTGILMVVFGGIGFLLMSQLLMYDISDELTVLYFMLLTTSAMLGFGIAGIAFAADLSKAAMVRIFGGILLVLKVIEIVWCVTLLAEWGAVVLFFPVNVYYLSGVVLPILYIVGGSIRIKGTAR